MYNRKIQEENLQFIKEKLKGYDLLRDRENPILKKLVLEYDNTVNLINSHLLDMIKY